MDAQPSTPARVIALVVLVGALLYCLFLAGLAEWNHEPFQVNLANFALFAAFIVVAGAIERFLEPISKVMPPFGSSPANKADRALLLGGLALIVGIVVSSVFGLYFLAAIGVQVGEQVATGAQPVVELRDTGDKLLRGLDIFVTALIITGGTKPLHDLIKSIEKRKEAAEAAAPGGVA